MAVTFRIPKLTDREIVAALGRIRAELKAKREFKLIVNVPHQGGVELPAENPEQTPQIKFVLDSNSQVIANFYLHDSAGNEAFAVVRKPESITDEAKLSDGWTNNRDENFRSQLPQLHVTLLSSARTELHANDAEAAFKGTEDSSWNRYRDAQTAVINSLQQATESLIIKASEKNAELDKARAERFEKLEVELRAQIDRERKELQLTFDTKQAQLTEREKAAVERESAFNTKEAGYVARKKQEEQIDQIKSWLNDWKLTLGTTEKRRPIFWGYITALVLTGVLTGYVTYRNYELLKSASDLAALAWWQWVAMTAKSFFPLAAFTTFMVYFIRWSSAWARQHAEEEFRNRTRLIDIGRSSWLLEAVRDSQQKGKDIPADLLKELSRNLFTNATSGETDLHPQALSDVMLQGLSSFRIKTPDGSEVEAKRDKKK